MPNICRQIELGRSGYFPETKVKWEGFPIPVPYMYLRTLSTVTYAEFCGPGDNLDNSWNDVLDCAIAAGGAVGILEIVADPDAALAAFEHAFKSCGVTKLGAQIDNIHVSLDTQKKPNHDWHR